MASCSDENLKKNKISYHSQSIGNRTIHTITLNPKHFIIKLTKATNNTTGRKTVSSMAKRHNAKIAINGGWFKVDGTPCGTLIIQGKQYSIKDKPQSLLVINSNTVSIIKSNPKNYFQPNISILSSLSPLLVKDGKIPIETLEKKEQPYSQHDGRTAIGITSNGNIIIVVVDHNYTRDLSKITAGDIQDLIAKKGAMLAKKYNKKNPNKLTLAELETILKKEYSTQNIHQKLSFLALARLMQKLGCKDAINLDGGKSSTLWINGKILNKTIGNERSISDAIIFQEASVPS
ncbi:MAG: phosphodiester glycosidase family protein [Rickettsiales bacterium]|nr:phosphodiester glycosidase family protein [Rickettsiales bacterium]